MKQPKIKLKVNSVYLLDGYFLRCKGVYPHGGGLFIVCDKDGLDKPVCYDGAVIDHMIRLVFRRVNELREVK